MTGRIIAHPIQGGPHSGTCILDVAGKHKSLEPSGLTIYADRRGVTWFYLVSDNGIIARRRTDLRGDWQIQDFGKGRKTDFEAITEAKRELMIGVEAGSQQGKDEPRFACVRRFDPDNTREGLLGSFTGSEWVLKDVDLRGAGGLEALTFVPEGAYPGAWGASSHYGGLFLASFQRTPGQVFVYDLPKGGRGEHGVAAIATYDAPLLKLKLSDMYYSPRCDVLYVLYDDKTDWLQELTLNQDKSGFEELRRFRLPYLGYEAIAEHEANMCLGLDPTAEEVERNGLVNSFIISMPWV